MSTRFCVREVPGDRPLVEKRGDVAALDREARALALLAGRAWAPRLVEHDPGRLVSTRMPGAPRRLADAGDDDLRRLGAVLAELHAVGRACSGALWGWDGPARSPSAFRARRADDAERALAGTAHAGLARRAAAVPLPADGADAPFCMVHGDLVEANVVWGSGGPALVDWEFWRTGDPAEDLAYLVETNGLADDAVTALLGGYGAQGARERLDAWRALVAADAGAWYLAQGMEADAGRLLGRAAGLLAGPPGRRVSPARRRPAGRGR